jgi:hypothetical protein
MKKINFKKLDLKKETISKLSKSSMFYINGGVTPVIDKETLKTNCCSKESYCECDGGKDTSLTK